MAKLQIAAGSTSVPLYVFIQDSSSLVGAGLTGLVYNSASLVASYVLPLAARVAISLATQTVTGAYSSGGFVEVDSTNMPGVYRFDIPNACLASGRGVVVMLKGAANMVPLLLEIDLAGEGALALIGGTDAIETGYTFKQTLRLMAAALAGKVSGGPTSPVFRNLADSAARITATVDGSGNRTAVTHSA